MNPENLYKRFFDQSQKGTAIRKLIFDEAGNPVDYEFIEVNTSFETLSGRTRDQLVGKRFSEIFPNDTSYWLKEFAEVALTGSPMSFVSYAPRIDRHVEVSTSRLAEGVFATTLSDVTCNVLAEQQLKETEERLQFALEGSEDGIWDWNVATNELISTHTLAGASSNRELHKRSLEEFLSHMDPDDAMKVQRTLTEHVRGDTPLIEVEYRTISRDGEVRWFLTRGKTMQYSSDGRPLRVVGTFRNITHHKVNEEAILYLTFHDRLTGVYNRSYYESQIKRLSAPEFLPLSVAMADANGLKLVNDAFGHAAGDMLLKKIAECIKTAARPQDLVARIGGDEFIILMPNTDATGARSFMLRLESICQEADSTLIPTILSIGAATELHADSEISSLLRRAEDRMYAHKLTAGKETRRRIVESLCRSLEEKTHETRDHIHSLQTWVEHMANDLNLNTDQKEDLNSLCVLHDIGKVALEPQLLNKAKRLTSEEWDRVCKHSEIGYRIAAASIEFMPIAELILCHHEQWNGLGYPRGLKGRAIPFLARVFVVVNALVSMTEPRPYRNALTMEQAIAELLAHSGSAFDPSLVETIVRLASVS